MQNGTFLTNKHNPSSIGTQTAGYRTVTVNPPTELSVFITAGQYTVREYSNSAYPQSPELYELEPYDVSKVTGSGIMPYSSTPTTACDRFVVVNGLKQGPHIYAEKSTTISGHVSSGQYSLINEYL